MGEAARVLVPGEGLAISHGLIRQGELRGLRSDEIERHLPRLLQEYPQLQELIRGGSPRNDNSTTIDLGDGVRIDAGPIAFARGLNYIFKGVEVAEHAEFRARDFIPVSTEVEPGSLTASYRMYNRSGRAKPISDTLMATDPPVADVAAKEWTSPILTYGSSYIFTLMEVMRAARLQVPVESMKADAARDAMEYFFETVACKGYNATGTGLTGITNAAGVAATTQVSTGTWLAQIAAIGAATAAEPAAAVAAVQGIIADINAMKASIITKTYGRWRPTTLLLPTNLWSAFDAVPRSPAFTDDSLLDYIRKLTGLEVDFWPQLDDAGATGGLGRVMMYCKHPRVLRLIEPMPFTQLPPQPRAFAWLTPCWAQVGGVNVMQPLAVTYMDGLN